MEAKAEAAKPAKAIGKKKAAVTAKSAAPIAATGVPQIDTSLAAATAARLVAAKHALQSATSNEPRKETSAFKQLKQSVANPHGSAIAGLLNSTASEASKKSTLPFGQSVKQIGRNQTYGADATRTNLPRRTGG